MKYEHLDFKKPIESKDYPSSSAHAIYTIGEIMRDAIENGRNQIIINTNLKLGLPMENINKIAGPFIEAWAFETFFDAVESGEARWGLVNVEALERLNRADILLQFKKIQIYTSSFSAEVDVKATSEDVEGSGKSPNITSFARIRSAYGEDADHLFIVLSLKHKVFSTRNPVSKLMDGVMEVVSHQAYDLKYLSETDISYNPALGTGQIQIKDIHYIQSTHRDAWEFCQLLDKKYLASSKRSFEDWLQLAHKNHWIK